MKNNTFDRLEEHLRELFEENLPKIFTGHQPHHTLVDELIQVMRDNVLQDPAGRLYAPDLFIFTVPTDDMIEWQMHRDILAEITQSILETGISVGLSFHKPPKIELLTDIESVRGRFSISAHFSQQNPGLPDTAAMVQQGDDDDEPTVPENAMLIIGGKTYFLLEKPVVDIGRHSGNDLILTDLQVSRHHAQLRAINNHYVIFDVGSTGGLFLNGKRINQATLHAGDVIRIGSVNLIYNQETTSAQSTSVMAVEDDFDFSGDDE